MSHNRPKSVYLTARSMSALRAADSLSARMNVIIDRYLELVARDRERVRGKFAPAEWAELVAVDDLSRGEPMSAAATHAALTGAVEGKALRQILRDLTGGESLVLLELLENERWGEPAALQ